MPRLADTNILLRFVDTTDPDHELVRGAVTSLMAQGERLCYTQQNRREFWNVCTRHLLAIASVRIFAPYVRPWATR